ncbi:hypothetical protein KRM28CT15_20340 [Krasilnikovia sp. M28-CT-15]
MAELPSAAGDRLVSEPRHGLTLRWSLPVVRLVAIGLLAAGAAVLAWTLLPLAWGWQSAVIVSGSMSPRVHRGDVVISSPPAPGWQPAMGQVVTVPDQVHPGHTLTHRIVGFDEQGRLMTRGDANGSDDPFLTDRDQVQGIGRLLVPRIGLATLLLREGHPGLFVTQSLVVLVALGLVLRLPATPHDQAEAEASQQGPAEAEVSGHGPADADASADGAGAAQESGQGTADAETSEQATADAETSEQGTAGAGTSEHRAVKAGASLPARPKRSGKARPRRKHPRNSRPRRKRPARA